MLTPAIKERINKLELLADYLKNEIFVESFSKAYFKDTAFLIKDIISREINTPYELLKTERDNIGSIQDRKPLGTVSVLMPKNSLGLTLAKAVASSFLAGNKTLIYFPSALKHSSVAYGKAIEDHLPGVFVAGQGQTSAAFMRSCLKSEEVKAIVVYGDDSWIDQYKSLAESTGTKIIFEGPGNDPFVVMPDADITAAVEGAIWSGLNNGGQSCSASERFFVHADIHDQFRDSLISRLKNLRKGDPSDISTEIGPIASRIVFERIKKQITDSVLQGARVCEGGEILHEPKTGFPVLTPLVIENCTPEMPVVAHETFGPVFPILKFKSLEDLITQIDQTRYGLNASVYGTPYPELKEYLFQNHRNIYFDSTCVSAENLPTRLMDGGYRRSGLIWEFENGYQETTGLRSLLIELSRPN